MNVARFVFNACDVCLKGVCVCACVCVSVTFSMVTMQQTHTGIVESLVYMARVDLHNGLGI